jgi:L-ascorbate metabolism protein UlaG (beta-lactamase superfamily)
MSADRITYVGHGTVLIEIGGSRLLTDPLLRPRVLGLIHRHGSAPADEVTEDIDAVLLSHLHHDHVDFPSLKRLGREVPIAVPPNAGRTVRRRGFTEVVEIGAGERTELGGVEVTGTPAVHEGRRFKFGPKVEAVGYEVAGGGHRVYFAGDTELFDEMAAMAGRIDVALLPIAGWGPQLEGKGHLTPTTAADAAALIRPRVVIPIHWGTLLRFDLRRKADEFLGGPAKTFAGAMADVAPEVELRILQPGESLELS